MLSGTVDPECPQPRRTILSRIVGAVTPMLVATCADGEPDRQATKVLGRATIHSAVTGAAAAGRERFVTAPQTDVGACGATDRANSTALN
jgi:hypothetical protein